MEREQALEEFLREFKKTINISALFHREHPLFVKATQDFKKFLDALFPILNPISIGITPESLLVENKFLGEENSPYGELAKFLHKRRIQSIEIRQGVSLEELLTFLSCLASHPKELVIAGGIQHLLEATGVQHVTVIELDYSQLLKGSGAECKDIWIYLLRDAINKQDTEKIEALAQNFGKMLGHFRIKDIIENQESKENILKFLKYLKDNGKESFFACAKDVSRALLRGKDIISGAMDIDRLKMFFDGLTDDDLADMLSQGLIEEDGLSNLSFSLFAKMLDVSRHQRVATLTAQTLKSKPVPDPQKLARSIKQLFSTEESPISQVYRNTLAGLLQETSFTKTVQFDRSTLRRNYAFILLNLLVEEKDKGKITLLLDKITVELDDIIRHRDAEYVKFLLEAIRARQEAHPEWRDLFTKPQQMIFTFIEHALLADELDESFQDFASTMTASSLGLDFYLDKIFFEELLSPTSLRLFLRFFPGELPSFYAHLGKKITDLVFLQRLIDALGSTESPAAVEILKNIYVRSNNFIKREVLIAMQKLSHYDAEFLLAVLFVADTSLKKEALIILRKDDLLRRRALEKLFLIKNPWGFKNRLILENILAVEEIGMRAATEYLVALAKRRFIWHWSVARKAAHVLKKWAR